VFYAGKAPKGEKTNWIMHEYRLADVDRSARKKGNNLRLDDWVLCRIYNKKGSLEKLITTVVSKPTDDSSESYEQKPDIDGTQLVPSNPSTMFNELTFTSDSVPKLHADSSCSEHVASPKFSCEVQSKMTEWEKFNLDYAYNYLDATIENDFVSRCQSNNQLSPLQDMFMYLQKPY